MHRPDRRRSGHPGPHRGHHLSRRGDPRDGLLRSRPRDLARDQHRVRQRPLRPGQPERPVRPRADAAPDGLPAGPRHDPVQHPHADDRPHGRRQPLDLHRAVRRPARPAAVQLLQGLQPRRDHRPGGLLRLLDEPLRRHGRDTDGGSRQHAVDGLQRHGAGQWPAEPSDAGALGAVHPSGLRRRRLLDRQHGPRERQGRPADDLRRRLARGAAVRRRPRLLQGRRDRRLHR